MNAPNRAAEVKAICDAHPEAFGEPMETNDARRLTLLRDVIIPMLNQLDGGQWGLLTKTNQNGKIPCDILTYRDTREIFDVMTGTGASWIALGPVPYPEWQWTPVVPPPAPDPSQPPPTPDLPPAYLSVLNAILDRLHTLDVELAALHHEHLVLSQQVYRTSLWGIPVVLKPGPP